MADLVKDLQSKMDEYSRLEKEAVKIAERKSMKLQQLKEIEDELVALGVDPKNAEQELAKLELELVELQKKLDVANEEGRKSIEKIQGGITN